MQQALMVLLALPDRQALKDQLAQQLLVRKASKAFRVSQARLDLRAQLVLKALRVLLVRLVLKAFRGSQVQLAQQVLRGRKA